MNTQNNTNVQPAGQPPSCAPTTGSDPEGHVAKRFVIYQQPGFIPMKKGPFLTDEQVEKMLIEMRPHHHADTIYTVAQVTHDHDIWLSPASEFLAFMEICRMPDGDDQNTTVSNPARSGHESKP